MFYVINIIIIILPMGYINAGKGNSGSTAYLFIIMIGITFLFKKNVRNALIILLGITWSILFYIEFAYPNMIETYSYEMLFKDKLIQLPLTLIAGYLLLSQFADAYIREHEQLNTYSIQLQEANKKLEFLANRDTLTKLYNRRAFDLKLDNIIKEQRQFKSDIYVILFDVDLFKVINDTFGHSIGDSVLYQIASNFSNILPESVFFSRWGGDEFAIIFYDSKDEVEKYTNELMKELKNIRINENYVITISAGITKIIENDKTNHVFKRVDQGLYKSKENGRSCYTFI
jgi:diguanylate cyclase (GGDEF)-like protein